MNFEQYRAKVKKAFDDLDKYPEKKDGLVEKVIEELWKFEVLKEEYVSMFEHTKEKNEFIKEQNKKIKKLEAELENVKESK